MSSSLSPSTSSLSKVSSSESLSNSSASSAHRLSLQHIFNSCVLDKYQRVNAGELIRHFRFVAEQNAETFTVPLDFAFLLHELGGSDQQVTFEQWFNAVEKLYAELVHLSNVRTPVSKSLPSHSSSKKRRNNKENLDAQSHDEGSTMNFIELRRKSHDIDKCQTERNELIEINRRHSECLRMLEEEYKKLEEDHQRLQREKEDLLKKKVTLEDELNRNTKYINENVDLHVYKTQLETTLRDLKEENELCEREKFELREQIIELEHHVQTVQEDRDRLFLQLNQVEEQLKKESVSRAELDEKCHDYENQLKEHRQTINNLEKTMESLHLTNQEILRKNSTLEKTIDELREKLRNAKTESIEARLSISNLCDEESFLCDELEERVEISRRVALSNGQSLFAEINTMDNLSHECLSHCLDSSNMETIDDMEVQILLSKSDSFNSIYLKDLFHELHSHGTNLHEHLNTFIEQIRCDEDRTYLSTVFNTIEKDFSTIKTLMKKLFDNKDVFEGRFRKLQSLLIASREKQQKFQTDLKEFSRSISSDVNASNVLNILKDYRQTIEELQYKEQLSDDKVRSLEEELTRVKAEEKAQRLKCFFLSKQLKKLSSKTKEQHDVDRSGGQTQTCLVVSALSPVKRLRVPDSLSDLTSGICPFHAVQEILRDEEDLFQSTASLLPCRCLNRSRSTSALNEFVSSVQQHRRLSSPVSSLPSVGGGTATDSGVNSSTGCSTSRSITPDLSEQSSTMRFEIESIFDRTLTKLETSKDNEKKRSTRALTTFHPRRSERVKRVLKRLQWCAIITSCSIVLFLWSVIIRYYCLTSPTDDDCHRLSFAWWPFAYCSTNGITL